MPGRVRHRTDGLGQRRVRRPAGARRRRADRRGPRRRPPGARGQAAALPALGGPQRQYGLRRRGRARHRVRRARSSPPGRHRRAHRDRPRHRSPGTHRPAGDPSPRPERHMKPILFDRIDEPALNTLEVYERRGGYEMLRKALTMTPEDVLAQIMDSGIRGRGGAGFQMGRKISFLPHGDMVKYLVCNADESEPGTFKDRELMQKIPHALIEGIAIAAYAGGINKSFIYIRGEYQLQADILEAAIAEAADAGYLGERILGADFTMSLVLHRGAGAYICGEETGLLDSLEGKRGNPRLKPPFPAIEGLYAGPT